MSSLADLPEIVGFFSYSREDDEDSDGAISKLRERVQRELSSQLGRSRGEFRLWQDTGAIAHGTLWEKELQAAVAQSVFFIPIVTPRSIKSAHCRIEFESFLAREAGLGRDDLIFPLLYIPVPALEKDSLWRADPVLSVIGARQYLDWHKLRHNELTSTEVRAKLEQFCRHIADALTRQVESAGSVDGPEIAARRQAEEARQEQQRQEHARQEQERQEQARLEQVRLEQVRQQQERERLEREQQEKDRQEAARRELERQEKARLDRERDEQARREQERQERARLETERQQQARLEQARLEDARQQRERQEQALQKRERLREREKQQANIDTGAVADSPQLVEQLAITSRRPSRSLLTGAAVVVAGAAVIWLLVEAPRPVPSAAEHPSSQAAAPEPSKHPTSQGTGLRPAEPAPSQATAPQPSQPAQAAADKIAPLSTDAERALKPKDNFKECANCPDMVMVPAGQFTMGSSKDDVDNGVAGENEGPQHKVVFAQPFAVGRYEVTKDEFENFVQASGYKFGDRCTTFENDIPQERADRSFRNPGFAQAANNPAVCVNWTDAKAYVAWLAQTTGKPYRLLSESEWEYAARSGSTTEFGFGSNAADLCKFANGADQSAKLAKLPADYAYMPCTDGYAYTAPVGSFGANAWGLNDFLGNVWELTEDCYADSYAGASTDGSPREVPTCTGRTARGGSWFSNAAQLRPAVRAKADPATRNDDLGFRVARPLAP